jgi:hypothetical protein
MKILLLIQIIYYFTAAVWPLVHIKSFMAVTGPKTDIWLVKTVSALLLAMSGAMLVAVFFNQINSVAIVLAVCSCVALLLIDVYYVLREIISPAYLADAAAELILLIAWMYLLEVGTA